MRSMEDGAPTSRAPSAASSIVPPGRSAAAWGVRSVRRTGAQEYGGSRPGRHADRRSGLRLRRAARRRTLGRVVTCVCERCQDSDVVWVRTPEYDAAAAAEEVIGEASPTPPGRWRLGRIVRWALAGAAVIATVSVAAVRDVGAPGAGPWRSGPGRRACCGRRGSLRGAGRRAPRGRHGGDRRGDLRADRRAGAAHSAGRNSRACSGDRATRRNGPAGRSFDQPAMGVCRRGP